MHESLKTKNPDDAPKLVCVARHQGRVAGSGHGGDLKVVAAN